jgi:hypothetical protein
MMILAGGFFLLTNGVASEDAEQFKKWFAEAWDRVPPYDQKKILAAYSDQAIVRVGPPYRHDGIAQAGTPEEGFLMRANSMAIFNFPREEGWVPLVISEELAHAFLFASADSTHVPVVAIKDEAEKAACSVMKRWGCDMDKHTQIIEWAKEKWKAVN